MSLVHRFSLVLSISVPLLGVALFGAGCPGAESVDSGSEPDPEQAVVDLVATFDTAGFTRISAEPETTQHAASPQGIVWVTSEHAAAYRELDPADATSTHAAFPVGFTAIKQQVDDAGEPVGRLLVMSKFSEGFSPDDADWWWGLFENQTELSGTAGVVSFCIDCHVGNDLTRTDYMLGVANDNHL